VQAVPYALIASQYGKDVADKFAGPIFRFVPTTNLAVYRYWGGISDPRGHWLTTSKTVEMIKSSGISPINALALPEGATGANLQPWILKPGSEILVGRIKDGAAWATQIFLRDSSALVLP
jgi:hypothetical protein